MDGNHQAVLKGGEPQINRRLNADFCRQKECPLSGSMPLEPRMNANGTGQNRIQGVGLAHTKRGAFESIDFFSFHPFPIGVHSRPFAVPTA